MKKLQILLPSLLTITSAPLATLCSCNSMAGTILQFSAIKEDTFNGVPNVAGQSKQFSIVFFDGGQIIDVTKDVTITFSDYTNNLTWNANNQTISWDDSFNKGDYPLTITATYLNKTVSKDIKLSFDENYGELYFANVTTEENTYWFHSGQSDEILLYYFDGQKLINVTNEAEFTLSQYGDIFTIENNRLTWPNDVIPGTYQFTITATYKNVKVTSDLLTVHAHGAPADDFYWEVINDTEAKLWYYNGDADHEKEMYLPETGTKDGKTYAFTTISQDPSSAQESFPGTEIVHLNQNLKTINDNGIYGKQISQLKEIYLPSSLEKLGKNSFLSLPKIETVYYPDSLYDWIMKIDKDKDMFKFCESEYQLKFIADNLSLEKTDPRINFNKNSKEDFVFETSSDTFAISGLQESATTQETIVIPGTIDIASNKQNATYSLSELKTNAISSESLITLCLPPQLKKICASAISCDNLSAIYYLGTKEQWNAIEKEEGWIDKSVPINCLDGAFLA